MKRLAGLLVACCLASSCGFGSKEALATKIEGAADRTLLQPSIAGRLDAHLRVVKTGILSDLATQPPLPVRASFVVRTGREAKLSAPFPEVVFTNQRIFLKRPDAAPREARPWLELALADVTDEESPFDPRDHTFSATRALVATIDPRILLDIAAAPLTGSLEDLGAENGVEHFRANFDIEKAMDDRRSDFYDEDRMETVELLLEQLSVKDGVIPGEVWFTKDAIKRVRLELEVAPTRFEVTKLAVDISLDASARSSLVTKPDDAQVIVVDSLAALHRSAGQGLTRG